jgi:cell division protein FtsZ
MPRVEDFPPMVKAEVESHGTRAHASEEDDRGPLGLLKRLTHGLSREEKAAPAQKACVLRRAVSNSVRQNRAGNCRRTPSFTRRARDNWTIKDRAPAAGPASAEEDQLEIPAFLRRQAN